MSATTYVAKRLSPQTQAKVDRIMAASERKQRIKRIRAGLQRSG